MRALQDLGWARLGLAVAALALDHALTTGFAVGAEAQDARPLSPDVPVERELSPREVHTYRALFTRGDLIRFTIEQKGIDVAAALTGPDGRDVVAVDAMDDEFRPEVIA